MTSEAAEILHDQHAHPGPRTYTKVALWLTVVTIFEILAYVFERQLGALVAPVILFLSALKFVGVAMWYMHLKFDSRIFSGIFLFPLSLAALVIFGLLLLYHALHPLPWVG